VASPRCWFVLAAGLLEISPKVVGANYADASRRDWLTLLVPLLKLAYPIVWFRQPVVSQC